ncbi:MAG TPA: NAD(P)/FAD-dependent oxidoreductase [Dehalococcoidia bacterium]|nr:NAD(P)/FAD-dependent oxidoreductase [Dehalococcoidia bacterium]
MKAAIIGGGVAGLTAAYRLAQAGHEVALFEASPELGGLVRTFEAGGEPLECFYHHLFTTDTTIVGLIEELGLGDRLTWRDSKVGFYHGGRIWNFVTPMDLLRFKPLPLVDRIRLGLAGLYLRRQNDWRRYESITAWEWIRRYAGQKALDVVWGPLLRGKFADQAEEVAMAWLWSKVHLRFSSRGSGPSQREKLGYMLGSFRVYIAELERRLRERARVETSQPVRRIEVSAGRASGLLLADGRRVEADAVIACVPSERFLAIAPPLDEEYERRVKAARWQSALCYVVALKHSLTPIYWLNISDAGIPFIAVIEHTNFIEKERYGGLHLVYLSNYLKPDHPWMVLSDQELDDLYLPHLQKFNPSFSRDWIVDRWVFRGPNAQPVIRCHYRDDLPDHCTPVPGLYLANMQQIYPEDRGQNYSIRMGEQVARMAMEDWTTVTATVAEGVL